MIFPIGTLLPKQGEHETQSLGPLNISQNERVQDQNDFLTTKYVIWLAKR